MDSAPVSLTRNERRVRSILLLGIEPRPQHEATADAETLAASAPEELRAEAAARAAIAEARERLLATATRIEDARFRESFLRNVPENALTLDLAAAWLEPDA